MTPLNDNQRLYMWMGIAALVAMGLYPPWQEVGGNPASYGFLYTPPLVPDHAVKIDWSRLLLQWSLVGFVTGGLLASTHKGTQQETKTAEAKRHDSNQPVKTEKSKTIKFPEDSNLGEVLVDAEDDPDYWEGIGQARGIIKIPADRNVQLELPKDAVLFLSALKELDPHAIQSMDFSESKVKDDDLAFLAHFGRLYEVDLSHTAIGDSGVEYLAKVTSLKKIWLDNTKVSDEALEKLKALQALTKLSLVGTEVTEASIKKLKDQFPKECEIIMATGVKA